MTLGACVSCLKGVKAIDPHCHARKGNTDISSSLTSSLRPVFPDLLTVSLGGWCSVFNDHIPHTQRRSHILQPQKQITIRVHLLLSLGPKTSSSPTGGHCSRCQCGGCGCKKTLVVIRPGALPPGASKAISDWTPPGHLTAGLSAGTRAHVLFNNTWVCIGGKGIHPGWELSPCSRLQLKQQSGSSGEGGSKRGRWTAGESGTT